MRFFFQYHFLKYIFLFFAFTVVVSCVSNKENDQYVTQLEVHSSSKEFEFFDIDGLQLLKVKLDNIGKLAVKEPDDIDAKLSIAGFSLFEETEHTLTFSSGDVSDKIQTISIDTEQGTTQITWYDSKSRYLIMDEIEGQLNNYPVVLTENGMVYYRLDLNGSSYIAGLERNKAVFIETFIIVNEADLQQ